MNRNDKNKKFTPLNINNVFKGKSVDPQNKTSYRSPGMQNIGKVSSMRRVPAPKWVPSIKAETGASENRQIINQSSSGWVSSNPDGSDQNMVQNQSFVNRDKNQWTSKASSNKPFFLMGQEFPSLQSEVCQDVSSESAKDNNNKLKDTDSVKSKLEELRNRDNTISASTLNRIDALSISKSSKGDIAATGWAAEDEEPNFDEKIVFSDEESLNEAHNWHSDVEDVSKSDNARMGQHPSHEHQLSMEDAWFDPNQAAHFPQFQQFQMQMNLASNAFLANAQFSQAMINRSSTSSVTNNSDDPSAFLNSVAEQRNARNMEYCLAIDRARQKKMGNSRVYGAFGEDGMQPDHVLARSRHTSVTSDTTESNINPIEMGPPGGPPLMYGHMHKPHISPMMHPAGAIPMMSPPLAGQSSLIRFSQPQFMMPIQTVPLEHIADPKLMEKWVEFLKQQSTSSEAHLMRPVMNRNIQEDSSGMRQVQGRTSESRNVHEDTSGMREGQGRTSESRNMQEDTSGIRQGQGRTSESRNVQEDTSGMRQAQGRTSESRNMQEDTSGIRQAQGRTSESRNMQEDTSLIREGQGRTSESRNIYEECSGMRQGQGRTSDSRNIFDESSVARQVLARPSESRNVQDGSYTESDRAISQSPLSHMRSTDKRRVETTERKAETTDTGQKESTRKTKSLYSTEDDGSKADNIKRSYRTKYGNFKEYRPSKQNYKGDYGSNMGQDYCQEYSEPYRGDDDLAYEDYHVYQQHYPSERHRDYKNSHDYRRNQPYQYYDESYNRDVTDYTYASNSLKYKSTKTKDYNKTSGTQIDSSQSDRGLTLTNKKTSVDIQEPHHSDKDTFDTTERKSNKETWRGAKSNTSSYGNKRYDNRQYKDRPSETRQEFSMGFAVNPKDSRRSYYGSSSYNRPTYYGTDYMYYHYGTNDGSGAQYHHEYNDNYYQSDGYGTYQYEQDNGGYQSTKSVKRPIKTVTEPWRTRDDRSSKSKSDNGQTKTNGRTNRKGDKRQSSMPKDSTNDNDQDEWETASEGGSVRSNSAPRDVIKSNTRHQQQGDQPIAKEEANKRGQSSTSENRYGSGNSCHGTWPSYPDEDGSDGASGSAGGGRTPTTRSNITQSKSTESTQKTSTDNNSANKTGTTDSASKDGSNNNNSHKESPKALERNNRSFADFIDSSKSSSVINVDKLPEVTEDEELLYENVEQFQEVLSKATKKNRKLEEQKRLREETEQKRLEVLRLKNKNDSNKIIKKPLYKKDQPQQKTEKSEGNVARKIDNKTVIVSRDKDILINNNNNNNFKKYECTKVSMQIGSWDNSLADEINSDRKVPLKPIGTPASTSSWNVKVKSLPQATTMIANNSTVSRGPTEPVKENIKPQIEIKNPQSSKNVYHVSSENSDVNYNSQITYPYKNSIYDRTNEDKKLKDQLEPKAVDITIPESITFDYDVKNINCDKQKRNALIGDRNLQKNDQQSLNDKFNLVKNIWDTQPMNIVTTESAEVNRPSVTVNADLDINSTNTIQDTIVSRNAEVTPALSITNVCKVKPQLQQDFIKKDPNEALISSSTYAFRNSPATFLAQNQGNFMPYAHRIPPEFLQDHLQASDALASLFSTNQQGVHINYNLSNAHLLDSSLLRQNPQDHMLSNKMNFISQPSSFYPQAAVTPKLFSNAGGQLPLNMDISSSHGPLPLQQLLLTRQNSLTSMMQPNGLSIPFLQSSQQHHAQTPLFPTAPILGPPTFTNPFSQGHLPAHYSPGHYQSLQPHNVHFQQSHQMLLNQQQQQQHHHHQQQQQQQQQQHHQQMFQNHLSHDRVINNGQSGIYNSIMGSSDISANTGLPDFNGQTKHMNHNNIMHGLNASTIMLPHNLNILMKPHIFATNSQYNSLQAPIQSNHLNVRSGYDNHSNFKLATELDGYKSSDTGVIDRNTYCIDNYMALQKQRDEFYIDQSNEYENCDINNDNWTGNIRQNNANNFLQTLDFQSQRSPLPFPLVDPIMSCNDNQYRNFVANVRETTYASLSNNSHSNSNYSSTHRNKPQYHQDQVCHVMKQTCRGYDNGTYATTEHTFSSNNKNDTTDNNNKKGNKNPSDSTTVIEDSVNSEKSFSGNKKNAKQRSSFSDNFEDKNQSWSVIEDDNLDSVVKLKSNCNIESVSGGGGGGGGGGGNLDQGHTHSPNKPYNAQRANNIMFDNQCQYGYDETQLSSQTAESLGKFDSTQMKKMIMKLREGPVMTSADFDGFEGSGANNNNNNNNNMGHMSTRKAAVTPRIIAPFQSSRNNNRPSQNKAYMNNNNNNNNQHSFDTNNVTEFAGMGFYSRNRALTPPPAVTHTRNYKSKGVSGRYQSGGCVSSTNVTSTTSTVGVGVGMVAVTSGSSTGTSTSSSSGSSYKRVATGHPSMDMDTTMDTIMDTKEHSTDVCASATDYQVVSQLTAQLETDNNNMMIRDSTIIDSPLL